MVYNYCGTGLVCFEVFLLVHSVFQLGPLLLYCSYPAAWVHTSSIKSWTWNTEGKDNRELVVSSYFRNDITINR